MGFNFGAMLGGAATQIVDDINEKEKDVKLRTRTILDRQVAQTAANQKEYKANKKKVTEQMNALVGLFGNTPEGIAKARNIVAGGDTHYTNMYGKLQTHSEQGGDVNELVTLTKGSEDIGFTGVEQATDSIVKLASLPELKMGTGFGANYFKKEQQAMIDAGLIQTMQLSETAKGSYGSVKVHLNKMAKKAKTVTELLDSTYSKLQNAKASGDQDKISIAQAAYKSAVDRHENESITLKSARLAAEAKSSGKSTYREISSNFAADIKRFENDLYVGGDKTKIRADNEDGFLGIRDGGDKIKQQKLKQYGVNWLKGQIDGNGDFINSEAEQFVKDNGTLRSLLPGVIASVTGEQTTGGGSKGSQVKDIVAQNESLSLDVVQQIKNINKSINQVDLHKFILKAYPKPDDLSQEDYNENVSNLIKETFKQEGISKDNIKKSDESISNLYKDKDDKNTKEKVSKVDPRPDDGKFFDSDKEDAWDKQYGDTHFTDGTPKPVAKKAAGAPDKDKFIKELGPEKGYTAYKAAVIKQLRRNFGDRAEIIFNDMEKQGKV